MHIHVDSTGFLTWTDTANTIRKVRCALGRGGISDKNGEGDGVTPIGGFALRRVRFRADKLARPDTGLDVLPIQKNDGWCDDPASPDYNRLVRLPHPASAEELWRDDSLYDVIVEVGYNDNPVISGKGSAIFMHVARPSYGPTQGCIALRQDDLLDLLTCCNGQTRLNITP